MIYESILNLILFRGIELIPIRLITFLFDIIKFFLIYDFPKKIFVPIGFRYF